MSWKETHNPHLVAIELLGGLLPTWVKYNL